MGDNRNIVDDKYAMICLIIIIALLAFILILRISGTLTFKVGSSSESTTVSKSDVEINSIKERISMIATNLGIDDTINTEETSKRLINSELRKNTQYQIDTNGDVIQGSKKIVNKNEEVLNATIKLQGNVTSVSFNI